MKLFNIVLLCFLVAQSTQFIQRQIQTEKSEQTDARRVQEQPVGVYTHWDCEIDYLETYNLKGSIMDKWKFFSQRPLCRWDCAMYKMQVEKGMTPEEIATAESRTSIFTWLKVYDPETNSKKEKVAVNSIIAIAFWFATGLPTFIAFVMFCFGPDINESIEAKPQKVKNAVESLPTEQQQNAQQNQPDQMFVNQENKEQS